MKRFMVNKSRYMAGLQCHKRLWNLVHETNKKKPDTYRKVLFKRGELVGSKAQKRFSDQIGRSGVFIKTKDPSVALIQTQLALKEKEILLFEAAFEHNEILIRADVLLQETEGNWHIIEVKSGTKVKRPAHIHDVALQFYVLRQCGFNLLNASIMHLNPNYTQPDNLINLFSISDVTKEVMELQHEVENNISLFLDVLSKPCSPLISVGAHCNQPISCEFKTQCWKNIPSNSIFTIPRLSKKKKMNLIEQDRLHVSQIPDDFPLSIAQRKYVDIATHKRVHYDIAKLKMKLKNLQFPLCFLDFETVSPPIPTISGYRPYEKFPFQYSLHILSENGSLQHLEFLDTKSLDPRHLLARHLVHNMPKIGTVIVYYASFEYSVIKKMAAEFPLLKNSLLNIANRLWDQRILIKETCNHWKCEGSLSLKRVLPAIVPELADAYNKLPVNNGMVAEATRENIYHITCESERKKMETMLKDYCKLDTLAMVEIHRTLHHISQKNIN